MEPQTRPQDGPSLDPALVKKLKWVLIAMIAIGIGVLAWSIYSEVRESELNARWDELDRIMDRYEPESLMQDPLFEDPANNYRARRDDYLKELDVFLAAHEGESDDALVPHTRWLIAKICADQVISMKAVLDPEVRRPYYTRAVEELTILHERHPDFQLNWGTFATRGFASETRRFLETLQANLRWEEEHLPRARAPSEDLVVLIRTERGDLRMGLYLDDAPEMTALFLERALRGDYDGTSFFAKGDRGRDEFPLLRTVRGGHPATRGVEPFERAAHAAFAEEEQVAPVMLSPTRYLVPATRGVVFAWHDEVDLYDGPAQFTIAVARSTLLDYEYSPIGKLLDADSLAVADRIFAGATWAEEPVGTEVDAADVGDFLLAPVRIVTVLVYRNGALVQAEGEVGPNKAPLADDEARLDDVTPDRYVAEAPRRPAPPTPPAPEMPGPDVPGEDVPGEDAPGEGVPGDGEPPAADDAPPAPGDDAEPEDPDDP